MQYTYFIPWLIQQNTKALSKLSQIAKATQFQTAQNLADHVKTEYAELEPILHEAYFAWQLYVLNMYILNIKGIMHPEQKMLTWGIRKDNTSVTLYTLPVNHRSPEETVAILVSNENLSDMETFRSSFELLISAYPELRRLHPLVGVLSIFMHNGGVNHGNILLPDGKFNPAEIPKTLPFYTTGFQIQLLNEDLFYHAANALTLLAFNGHNYNKEYEPTEPQEYIIKHSSIKFEKISYPYLALAIAHVTEVIQYCLSGAKGVKPEVFIAHPIKVFNKRSKKEVWNSLKLNI